MAIAGREPLVKRQWITRILAANVRPAEGVISKNLRPLRSDEEGAMPSIRKPTWVWVCLLLGVAQVSALATLAVATSAGARTPARCSVPPQAGADYARCNLTGVNFSDANLTGADFQGATLTNADLGGANLSGANLKNGTVTGADLGATDLSGATLTHVVSGGTTGTPASLPSEWTVVAGYLVGPYANLTGANLSGADLSSLDLYKVILNDADLSGANLTDATVKGSHLQGTVLADATLTGVISGGKITGTPASLPPDWTLVGTSIRYLAGPAADLANADLYGANVANTDLTDANLSDANLSFANLTGANLAGANLSGVIWSDTTCPDGTNSNNDGDTCVNNLG